MKKSEAFINLLNLEFPATSFEPEKGHENDWPKVLEGIQQMSQHGLPGPTFEIKSEIVYLKYQRLVDGEWTNMFCPMGDARFFDALDNIPECLIWSFDWLRITHVRGLSPALYSINVREGNFLSAAITELNTKLADIESDYEEIEMLGDSVKREALAVSLLENLDGLGKKVVSWSHVWRGGEFHFTISPDLVVSMDYE